MGGRRRPVPRRHCPECAPPKAPATSPPELAGRTCTATLGLDGDVCGRKATTVDKHGRPICNATVWTNVAAHLSGRHGIKPGDPAPGHHEEPIPLAPAAQDPPGSSEVSESADHPVFGEEMVRAAVRAELDSFATEVLKIPATMGNNQAALHPVGLCDDGRCQSCKAQRSAEHGQAKQFLAGEIESAIEHAGRDKVAELIRADGADAIAGILDDWRAAGRPAVQQAAQQIGVVAS